MTSIFLALLASLLTAADSFAPIHAFNLSPCRCSHRAASSCEGGTTFCCSHRSNTSLMMSITLTRRRVLLSSSLLLGSSSTWQLTRHSEEALAANKSVDDNSNVSKPFHSAASALKEYTNSIVASRDTNISPKEVYDTISSTYLQEAYDAAIKFKSSSDEDDRTTSPRALDVGAGAGVSTEVLYDLGYHDIDAIDWSATAWKTYVVDDESGYCPPSVRFYELDDERYFDQWSSSSNKQLFDVIIFNFAVNESKAKLFATELLNKQHGRLLAPINTSNDYWLKQTYQVLDGAGRVLWSAVDVGAWSVQFQPDVTQETCSGIWCAPFNGFQKKR